MSAPAQEEDRWLHVLVAEDNPLNQKVAEGFLHQLGCTSVVVEDGTGVLGQVQNNEFDLVLMDIRMPQMDGLEATQQLHDSIPAEQLPKIIALTADAMPGDEARYIEAGMDAYLIKPLHLKTLEATLRQLFPQ